MKSAHIKGKGQRPHSNKQTDGKGNKSDDPFFNYNMTILIGCSAEVTTRDGEVYEGIYVAFSSAMEILLEAAHLVTDNKDDSSIEKHFDVLVIPSEKVVSMKCLNADLTYPTREFATDTAISGGRGGGMRDKELTPWEGSEDTPDELSLDSGSANANGWEAKEMFKKNEEKYGVKSTFSQDLSGYTTQVDKNDTEFKRLEEQANQIASEIEKGTVSWERTQVENGDEEEAFSAVVRPQHKNNAPNTTVNNNNNTNSVANDKYIPPSRRQTNMQPSGPPPPLQQQPPHHQPSNNNGPPSQHPTSNNNNSGLTTRKPMYNQNQNSRSSNYGAPPNPVYHQHQDRRNFDSRGPPPRQYGNTSHGGEPRRPPIGGGGADDRQQRMPKQPIDRKDPAKLKEFGNNFKLQSQQEPSQLQRRYPPGPPAQVGAGGPHPMSGPPPPSSGVARNASPPSATNTISSNKIKKEESPASLPPLIPPSSSSLSSETNNSSVKSESSSSVTSNLPTAAAAGAMTTSAAAGGPSAVASSANTTIASPSTPNVASVSVNETTPPSSGSVSSPPVSENQTPTSTGGDSKAEADNKKKFTFNPNAKEFNPTKFASRSPSTPPRPPSTPATVATPQVMAPATNYQSMYISMTPAISMSMYPAPQPQQYAQALTPSSNSSASSGVNTPRHGGGHRKGGGGVVGIPPRSEMTPPIQMSAGPPMHAPGTTIQAAPPHTHTQYFVSQGHYPTVMRMVPQSVMPVFPTEGSGGNQIHAPPMHYIPQNSGNNHNNAGHQPNSTPQANPSQPTNLPPNSHGFGQQQGGNHTGNHPMPYPIVQLPVAAYGFHQAAPHNIIPISYVHSHSQGGTQTVIPPSQ